jgi:hypothetical protein
VHASAVDLQFLSVEPHPGLGNFKSKTALESRTRWFTFDSAVRARTAPRCYAQCGIGSTGASPCGRGRLQQTPEYCGRELERE